MEHNDGGLEDDIPVQLGDFKVPCQFQGCSAPFSDIPRGVGEKKMLIVVLKGYSVRVHG